MNRKERRGAAKRGKVPATLAYGKAEISSVADLLIEARRHFQQGRIAQAQDVCHQILTREPSHAQSLNLLGVIAQVSERHKTAINFFAKAIAADRFDAAIQYNIASSYQTLDQREKAAIHFKNAIVLGLSGKNAEDLILQNLTVAACVERAFEKWPLPIENEQLFGVAGIEPLAADVFLRCALESIPIHGMELEIFLTHLRSALLHFANHTVLTSRKVTESFIRFACALAQQCFINEYVFAQGSDETKLANELCGQLLERVKAGGEVQPLMLIAVATYFPLHSLAIAEGLLTRDWPDTVTGLLRQQIAEPLEEQRDRIAIPALTPFEDSVSLQVMQQYEENPYPRWTINPLGMLAGERKIKGEPAHSEGSGKEILITGCGTGAHAFQLAQYFPEARVLAIDISLPSLAHARRRTREEGLHNIEYAQADILKLGGIDRSFDCIEAMGVLHHLADPKAAWRGLLSLLRPDGEMRIGLYSEIARHSFVDARAFIAKRGYRATADNIRQFRQEIMGSSDILRWKNLIASADFYSMSGCRDLLFNVIEHRFTISQIKAVLNELGLTFLGFELESEVIEKFQQQFPGADTLTNLSHWDAFEAAHPQTFASMYVFSVKKNPQR